MKAIPWDGKPVSKPGLYRNIPLSTYHSANICAGPSVSSTGLRRIDVDNGGSPAHFYSEWPGNPKRKEQPEAKHLVLGRAVHHLILGEKQFSKNFVIRPDKAPDRKIMDWNEYQAWLQGKATAADLRDVPMKDWQGNRTECRDWTDAQRKIGKSVLTNEDVENITGMAASIGRLDLVKGQDDYGILNGQIERSIFYRDKQTGVWIKVRPDAIPSSSGVFVDLKTTTSVQWLDMMRAITDYKYHQQAALIRRAAIEVLKIPKDQFTFVLLFVEKEDPWCARTVQLKPDDLDMGDRQNRKAIDLFASCLKSGVWPGPGQFDDAPFIDLQDYYRNRIKEALE